MRKISGESRNERPWGPKEKKRPVHLDPVSLFATSAPTPPLLVP